VLPRQAWERRHLAASHLLSALPLTCTGWGYLLMSLVRYEESTWRRVRQARRSGRCSWSRGWPSRRSSINSSFIALATGIRDMRAGAAGIPPKKGNLMSTGIAADLRSIAEAAVMAPSADNQHCFELRARDDRILLSGSEAYVGAPFHKKLLSLISFGAVVENMTIRASATGIPNERSLATRPLAAATDRRVAAGARRTGRGPLSMMPSQVGTPIAESGLADRHSAKASAVSSSICCSPSTA
jgi:hypothetical protein